MKPPEPQGAAAYRRLGLGLRTARVPHRNLQQIPHIVSVKPEWGERADLNYRTLAMDKPNGRVRKGRDPRAVVEDSPEGKPETDLECRTIRINTKLTVFPSTVSTQSYCSLGRYRFRGFILESEKDKDTVFVFTSYY